MGGTNWFPNLDSLEFYSRDILPVIRSRVDERPTRWVGACEPDQQEKFRREFPVELTGYVDDVRPYMRDADVFVVPLRMGGGTRLKILNALATGKAVVSTSVGCEGLEAVDGENILIRDDPAAFGDAVADYCQIGPGETIREGRPGGLRKNCTAGRSSVDRRTRCIRRSSRRKNEFPEPGRLARG